MSKILFAKYNRDRRREFQISTTIYEEDGRRCAKKAPLTPEAVQQIAGMQKSYEKLQGIYRNIEMLQGQSDGADGLCFAFVKGESITDILLAAAKTGTKEEFLNTVKEMTDFAFDAQCPLDTFEATEEFRKVFGNAELKAETMPLTNVDLIFDNIVKADGKYICLDYEWVFDCPVPVDYVRYRSLHYFYVRNAKNLDESLSEQELMNACGIEDEFIPVFERMEESFQRWVFGEENYTARYVQHSEENVLQNYRFMQGRVLQLQEEQEERNKHITYLDGEIAELQERQDILQYEINNHRIQITFFEDLVRQKDNHINNITDGYNKWVRLTQNPAVKLLKLPKRVLRKVYRTCKSIKKYKKLKFKAYDNPQVSIIIPVYNQFDYTYNCLKSILEKTEGVTYEVIIGDDVSTDKTRKLEKVVSNIRVLHNEENLKFLLNCNHAAEYAKGDYILFLNNDTQVTEGWLSSLVELMESDDTIGMVGSKLIYPDGTLQEAGGIIWKDASGWNYGRNDDASKPEYNYVRETDYISGASIMIRHELWNTIGGFDELFVPAYCEDSDLAFEVRKHGYKVMYQPKSVVIHFEGVSNGTDLDAGLKKYQVENSKKFKEKWEAELAGHYDNATTLFRARERNFDKKVVLIVDHYVPTYDKDAGSKTTFQYIKMFLKKGYLVKFIGDNFAQMEPYTTALQKMGVEVLYGPWYQDHIFEWIEENQEHISFAYLNRPHITEKYIHFFTTKTNIKVIYYGHDLCCLRERREAQLTGDAELMKSSEIWRKRELAIMREAEMSYYPSAVEIDAIHEEDASIKAKAITAYVFDEFEEDFNFDPEEREGILFVGGFSHRPNVDAVKWFVDEIYPAIRTKETIPFYIVGSNAPKEIQELDGDGVVFKGFLSEEELDEMYRKVRIVVVPLRYGAGVKGKVIEALYKGVPVVTTNVGAEGIEGIEKIAVVRDVEEELATALVELYHDKERLVNMAERSQEYVKEHFSIDAAWKVIEEDFS